MSDNRRFDLEELRALIRLAAEADIEELEVQGAHVKVRIKKARHPGPAGHGGGVPHVDAAAAGAPGTGGSAVPEQRYTAIAAPMVGTFYRSAKPEGAPFVNEGDMIEAGQIVCILEAMKLFNEIPSEVTGRIVSILVENGAPVEYGQPLFLVDPSPAV